MNISKFTTIICLLVFVVINVIVLSPAIASDSQPKIGYGRGGRMSGGSKSPRADEPIQPIPISFDYNGAKVELGKKLFFEPRLSKSGWITCNSCHNLSTGGADNLPSSIGHKWFLGPINSPTVLNSKFNLA